MALQLTAPQITRLKIALFAVSLLPFGRLVYAAWSGDFGANPVEFVQRFTGTWTFNFLLITLTVTPLRAFTDWHWLLRTRRMLGLFTFFYASLHFLSFVGFDHSFDLTDIALDVVKRPFVTVGFAAFCLLVPLAATSNQLAIRRLGGKRWQALHRSVYLIGILAAFHYLWLVKATALIYPAIYGLILAVLLGWRARERMRRYGPYPAARPAAQPIKIFRAKP